MEKDYKQIQLGVDSIIKTKTIVRRRKRSTSDKKRETFFNLINGIEELIVRQNIMYSDLSLDFSNYDEKFFTVIDALLFMHFGKDCMEVISFYLYERVNADGTLNAILDEEDQEIILNNPYELWNLLCQINTKLDE